MAQGKTRRVGALGCVAQIIASPERAKEPGKPTPNPVEFHGFNSGEFATIKGQPGLNSYKISVKEWVEKTNAIGLRATAGRHGGTFAHKDLAFEFANKPPALGSCRLRSRGPY